MSSIDVFLLHPSPLHSFTRLLLVCPLIWLSSLCQSVPFLSSNLSPLLIPSRWLCLFPPCLSPHHLGPLWVYFLPLSPPPLTRHSSFSSVNLTWPVCLRFECPTLISLPFPPSALCSSPALLFIYIENDGGRAVRLDWWMARGHGWGDLGVWWTLLSVRILLKELAGSLL